MYLTFSRWLRIGCPHRQVTAWGVVFAVLRSVVIVVIVEFPARYNYQFGFVSEGEHEHHALCSHAISPAAVSSSAGSHTPARIVFNASGVVRSSFSISASA